MSLKSKSSPKFHTKSSTQKFKNPLESHISFVKNVSILLTQGSFLLSKNCVNSGEYKAPCKLVAVLHDCASKTRNSSKAHGLQEAWYIDVFPRIVCIAIFDTFARKWPEHANLGGGKRCYQFTHKMRKHAKNAVFGYKKGSKFESDIGSRSATQTLCIVIFSTFVWKWPEHTYLRGG